VVGRRAVVRRLPPSWIFLRTNYGNDRASGESPGAGFTLQGMPTREANIPAIVKALGVDAVRVVNPLDLKEVREAFAWALAFDDPSVISTRWPCALKKHSPQDDAEFGACRGKCSVDESKCIGCKMCIKTGCPASASIGQAEKRLSTPHSA